MSKRKPTRWQARQQDAVITQYTPGGEYDVHVRTPDIHTGDVVHTLTEAKQFAEDAVGEKIEWLT